ncbi:thiol reductant ABC exporter subunit CydD [Ancylobacter lacus]|nr:thiol reductant ABC exporter subunit CydD [Ancylobacter lacus]MBS7540994.1 thiol reductant ABC exporter subunit CydD [Ancylobacter lacus]
MAGAQEARQRKSRAARLLAGWRPLARRELAAAMVAGALGGAVIVAQAWVVASILDAALFRGAPPEALTGGLLALAGLLVLRAVAAYGAERFGFAAAMKVVPALRRAMLERLDRIGPLGLSGTPSGEIVAALADGVRGTEPFFSRYIPATSQAVVLPLGILIVVAPLDWVSALAFLVTAPLIPLFMALIGMGAEQRNQRQWRRLQRMSGHFLDAIQGIATLKAFNAGPRMVGEVAEAADGYRRDTMAVLRIAFLSSLTLEFFATVSIALVALMIGLRLMWGEMGYQHGLFVLLLAPEFYLPLRAMGTAYHARMESLGAAERLAALEDMPDMAESGAGVGAPPLPAGPVAIRFEDVRLDFADGRRALDGVSFTIPAGETWAVVGASGAGKSSLFALLMGFARPTGGRILVNGAPLAALDLAAFRAGLAYVPQRPTLFAADAAANIALGEAAPDAARVVQAARQAAIHARLEALPQGYATPLGEGGHALSGGEAHRVGLARAFYRDAPLVLLDEPTAHLDAGTEAAVQQAIAGLKPGRTLLVIAHRLASLAHADRILVLERGRVVEIGTEAALRAAGGTFAALVRSALAEGETPA